jgi:hypothetical protein
MNKNNTRVTVGWSFLIQWVVANAIGGIIASAVVLSVGLVLVYIFREFFGAIFMAILFGGIWGVAQWLILRRYLSWSGLWIVASLIGGVVAVLLAFKVENTLEVNVPATMVAPVAALLFGTTIGVCQWFMLRQRPWSVLWVGGSAVGAVAAGFTFSVSVFPLGIFIGEGLIRLTPYIAITGAVLIMLLRQTLGETEPRIGPISNGVSHLVVGCIILMIGIVAFQALR